METDARKIERLEAELLASRKVAKDWRKRANRYDKQAATWMKLSMTEHQENTRMRKLLGL